MQLSQNQKSFLNFVMNFLNLEEIRNTIKQKMSLAGYFFLKL